MSVRIMTRVWEHSQHAGSDLLILLAIADFADEDGRAYPAVPTLATKCRMTPRNANLILAHLRKSGELEVRQNKGPRGTNLYQVHVPVVVAPSSSTPEGGFIPEEYFTLKQTSPTPEAGFPKPLKPASDEPSVNHQGTVNKREVRSPSGSRLSADWSLPDSYAQWAMQEKGWTMKRCQEVGESFRDYWISIPGAKGRKADWLATWRNWVRRERDPVAAKRPPTPENFDQVNYGQSGLL